MGWRQVLSELKMIAQVHLSSLLPGFSLSKLHGARSSNKGVVAVAFAGHRSSLVKIVVGYARQNLRGWMKNSMGFSQGRYSGC